MRKIPNKYVLGIVAIGLLSIWLIPQITLIQRIEGFFLVSIPLLVMAYVKPGSIGGGDVKLMAAGGFLLGSADIWNAFVIGIMGAGLYVLLLLVLKKADRRTEIALGAFLSMGIVVQLLGK